MPKDSEIKNIEKIAKAIDQHNSNCAYPAVEVRMNPYELERLGWEEIKGIPIKPDGGIGTGRFRVVCGRDKVEEEEREVVNADAESGKRQTVTVP